jgi:hypothetical protein
MSFRCADCGKVKRYGSLVVRETRLKTYVEPREERGRVTLVEVGAGYETVREERVCTECQERS